MNESIKPLKSKKYFKKVDETFNKFQNTAIGNFVIEKLILRAKSFYSILSTFGLILVAQISVYYNTMQLSDKVDIKLNNSEGLAYAGWLIVSFIVPNGSIAVIVVLIFMIIGAWIIRYKELSQNNGNKVIESRSNALLENIKENSKYYVATENHYKAIEKLEATNVIIIAGEPGIGKTTLAENIVLSYIQQGFKFYDVESTIEEEFNICKKNEKQIFYFDDFLGENYLEAIENKQTSNIVKFINIIRIEKNKKFILTSRTNIFNQGLLLSDKLKSKNIENEEFIIKIGDLKEIDKAKILYNHIKYSKLDKEFIDEIYLDKRYKLIINHKNFNPRLIAFITDNKKVEKEQIIAKEYWNYIVEKLDNPQDVWKNTFDKQSDEFTRIIVALTVFYGNKVDENKLRDAYNRYIELTGLTSSSRASKDFDNIIEEVVKYFLNRNQTYNKKIEYSLFNPSIADFILNKYKNNLIMLKNIYKSLESDKALKKLFYLKKNELISDVDYLTILDELLMDVSIGKNADYLIKLNSLVHEISQIKVKKELIKTLIQSIIDGKIYTNLIEELSKLITLFDISEFNIQDFDFFYSIISYYSMDINEINSVIELYNYFNINDKKITADVNEMITNYIKEELSDEAASIHDVAFEETISEEGYFEVLDGEVEDRIDDIYSEIESSIEYFYNYDIDEDEVKSTIDIDEIKQRLSSDYTSEKFNDYAREKDDYNNHDDSLFDPEKDEIENLFDSLGRDNNDR